MTHARDTAALREPLRSPSATRENRPGAARRFAEAFRSSRGWWRMAISCAPCGNPAARLALTCQSETIGVGEWRAPRGLAARTGPAGEPDGRR